MSEIKDIPEHWEVKTLGEVCAILSGYGFPKNIQGSSSGEFPFYKVGDISKNVKAGYRTLKLCDNYIDAKTLSNLKAKPFPMNTIVFAKIGEGLKLNRRAIIGIPGIVDNNVVGVKAIENVCDDMFLFNFLTTVKLEDYSKATTVPSVRKSEIEQILFPLPPLSEQQAIVAKIEELLSELDNGKQQLQTALQQLKVYRQSLLKWAFEGKLTHSNVKEGELPDGWRIAELGTLSEMCLGKMLDKKKNKGSYQPYLRNISVRWGSFDLNGLEEMKFEPHEEERYSLNQGDLIVCEGGEPGRCAIWKGSVTNMKIQKALHRVRVKSMLSEIYLYHFMYYSAMSGLLKKYFTGTTIKHLTGRELKKIEIPLPPISEQQLIVDELESKLTLCDNVEETIKQSLQQAETLRQSILKQAFEGKLV